MPDHTKHRLLNRAKARDTILIQTIEPGWTREYRYSRWSDLEVDDVLDSLGTTLKCLRPSPLADTLTPE